MGKIVKVSGPLVVATGMEEANMADVVRVGEQRGWTGARAKAQGGPKA